jgi:hypothetical protein
MPHVTSCPACITSLRLVGPGVGFGEAARLGGNDYISHVKHALAIDFLNPICGLKLHSELQAAICTEDQRYLDKIHRGLQRVFNVSKYLDSPFTLDEVATYFLLGVQVAEEEVRALITHGEFIDLPFLIRDGHLLAGLPSRP